MRQNMKVNYFSSNELEFGDLPPALKENSDSRWGGVRESLMNRPNEWAIVAEQNGGKSPSIGQIKKSLGKNYEVASRRSDMTCKVYARYVDQEGSDE